MVRLNGRLSHSYGSYWSVNPPARQLEISLSLVKNRPDVVNAHSGCIKFPKNRVCAFGDQTSQCCLATTERCQHRP